MDETTQAQANGGDVKEHKMRLQQVQRTAVGRNWRRRGVGKARAASSTTKDVPKGGRSAQDAAQRAEEGLQLVQELAEITMQTGPKGFRRTVQVAQATLELASELAAERTFSAPQALRRLFEKLGATYIKLGQFIASSPTLFPEEYVLEFQKCLDKTDPVPYPVMEKILRKELGKPIEEVFESIEKTPLASASVAQVYGARLKGSEKDVVIKLLKPGVEDVLSTDLNFLYGSSRVLEFLNPELSRTSFSAIVGDIRKSMMDEVDFRKEAKNILEFTAFLERSEIEDAVAPFVYQAYTTQRMLVMERFYGVPLTDLEAIKEVSPNPEATLIAALNTWFASVLLSDSFHADVHAGNLFVLQNGKVGFIDFGIVGRIPPSIWSAVQGFLQSISTEDYRTMAQSLVQMGATGDTVDLDAFTKDLEELFEGLNRMDSDLVVQSRRSSSGATSVSAGVVVDDEQVNRLVLDIVRLGDAYGIKFPREFGILLKQLLYFDRYVRLLAPELEMMNDDRVRFVPSDPSSVVIDV